jgi:hypothetical protein
LSTCRDERYWSHEAVETDGVALVVLVAVVALRQAYFRHDGSHTLAGPVSAGDVYYRVWGLILMRVVVAALLVARSNQGPPPWEAVGPTGDCAPNSKAQQAFTDADAGGSPLPMRVCPMRGFAPGPGTVQMQYVGPPCTTQRDCTGTSVCDALAPAPELGTRCVLDETKALACPPDTVITGTVLTPGELGCASPPG